MPSRRPALTLAPLGALLLAGACGAPVAAPPPPKAPPAEPAAAPAPIVARLLPPRMGPHAYPVVVERGPDEIHVIAGALRAALGGEGVRWAADRFASAIASATFTRSGWIFVARDGTAARSEAFLGALHPIGGVAGEVIRGIEGGGRAGVIDAEGVLWTTDGIAPFARASGLPAGRVYRGAFADALRGAVIMNGGEAFATLDGGARWTRVGPPHEAAWWVEVDRGELVLTTTQGVMRIDAAGGAAVDPAAAGAYPPFAFPWSRTVEASLDRLLDRDEDRRFMRALFQRDPAELDVFGPIRAPGGRAVAPLVEGWGVFEASTGRWIQTIEPARTNGCTLFPWGPSAGAVCEQKIAVLDASLALSPIPGLKNPRGAVFSDDGLHAAALASCSGRGAVELCVIREGGASVAARPIQADVDQVELVEMRGSQLLLRIGSASDDTPDLHVLDVGRDTLSLLRIAPRDGRAATLVSASFGSGVVAGLAKVEGAPGPMLAIGAPSEPLALRALPKGAVAVGFRDARAGVAAGPSLAELWITDDGGERWSRITPAMTGDPARVRIDHEGVVRVACDATRCLAGGDVEVAIAPAIPGREERILAAGPPSPPPPRERSPWDEDMPIAGGSEHSWGSFGCEDVAPSPDRPLPPPKAMRIEVGHVELAALGVSARVDVWHGSDGEPSARVVWRGEIDGKAAAGATIDGPFPVDRPEADEGSPPRARYAIHAVDAGGLLLERCPDDRTSICQLFRAPARGPVTLVPDFTALASIANADKTIRSLATRDGGALILQDAGAGGADGVETPSIDLLVRLGPDGTTRWRRAFAWEQEHHALRVLARYRGRVGYAVSVTDNRRSLLYYALEDGASAAPEPLPEIPPGPLAPCRGPRHARAAELFPTLGNYHFMAHFHRGDDLFWGRPTIEVAPGSACLRGYEAPIALHDFGAGAPKKDDSFSTWATPEGELRGLLGVGATRQRVRCSKDP